MRLILDANEYIFGLDPTSGKQSSIRLIHEILPRLMTATDDLTLFVHETVRDEVQRNIAWFLVDDFYRLITSNPQVAWGWLHQIPPDLLDKYTVQGLKEADATIAAFADWLQVDFLISDNRHIYEHLQVDDFITCTAERFGQWVDSGEVWEELTTLRDRKARQQQKRLSE